MSDSSSGLGQLRKRTVDSLLRTWEEVRETAFHVFSSDIRPGVPKEDEGELRARMMLCLDSPGGEVTARANTAALGRIYLSLNESGRKKFLTMLAGDFDMNHESLLKLSHKYTIAKPDEKLALEVAMREALATPRSTILRQFTALPDGFKFLVNMRADLLPLLGNDAKLKALEFDLKQILASWFDVALLDLVEISWNSPAVILEKLIEYEAVHRVASWEDLKNRLDADRRVFAFFHHKMPAEPLIFVHVALVSGMSDNVQKLLDEKSPVFDTKEADTAIFYSISNAQKGLAGISFGNFLIKRVVEKLSAEMKNIKTYATLSPVPGLRAWLDPLIVAGPGDLLGKDDIAKLKELDGDWAKDAKKAEKMKPLLLKLCAHYLLKEKKHKRPLDPVANFHLFNGARLERLNWLGDSSAKGMKQSAGIMANYYYKLDEIDENHEAFAESGKIAASRAVKGLL
ncbi:MAG: malonyl-CoA decarboxylase family protein [Alphaproteobacteria bacterium]|nr:malonyl-CoA decarboxylase family protein [Alphaproteobacteria bacterium]